MFLFLQSVVEIVDSEDEPESSPKRMKRKNISIEEESTHPNIGDR
jgi:hypothetical protein